jgi:hypothetical protein
MKASWAPHDVARPLIASVGSQVRHDVAGGKGA